MADRFSRAAAGASILAGLLMVTGLVVWKNGGLNSKGPADTVMFFAFLAFLAWLLLPRRNKSAGHEQANQGLTFRFGKALKGVLRTNKR